MSEPTIPNFDTEEMRKAVQAQHPDDAAPEAPPKQIGPYHILDLIGEGGMGEVYKAERRLPMRQTVAIKIIKLGFNSREVIARFESERQALARMDHSCVARVLDTGTTENGRPYFVMEYVPGVPITRFCDDNKLNVRDRLLLFCQACEAIAHAHTKAIIHRDVKAANVLAYVHDDKATIKVIDFGIAKALTGDRLTDRTFNTQLGRVIGTYDSMSPEQAEGSPDIDTRTDVYSLGVLLYELLTGARPFDHETLSRAGDQEIRRIICEVEPPRPSTRIGQLGDDGTKLAQLRQSKLDALAKQLRSELEWIPLKAMRKERSRRYASSLQLVEDIHNYLEGHPLIAGPESRTYQLRKYVARHRAPVITAAAALLLVCIGTVLYIRGIRIEQQRTKSALLEAEKQKSEADRHREEADAVNEFLTRDVLAGASPANLPDKVVREAIVRKMIDPAASAVGTRFDDQPLIEAAVRNTLSLTYLSIGRADLGTPHAATALAIHRRLLGDSHPDTLNSINNLGGLLESQGRLSEAEALFREALECRRRALGDDHADTLASINNMGFLLQDQGKLADAEPLFREALKRRRTVLGDDHPDTLVSIDNMGSLLQDQGKLADAEPLKREALGRYRRVLGDDHPDTLRAINNMGYLLQAQGRFIEAEPLFAEGLERRRRVLGDDHVHTLSSINNMGALLRAQGKLTEAEPLYREALERSRRILGEDHPSTLVSINNMGGLLQDQGKLNEAEPLFEELYRRAAVSEVSPGQAALYLSRYGICLVKLGKYRQAEELLTNAHKRLLATGMEKNKRMREVVASLADVCENTNRPKDAARWRAELAVLEASTQPTTAPAELSVR